MTIEYLFKFLKNTSQIVDDFVLKKNFIHF
jgi:hypothetical protein